MFFLILSVISLFWLYGIGDPSSRYILPDYITRALAYFCKIVIIHVLCPSRCKKKFCKQEDISIVILWVWTIVYINTFDVCYRFSKVKILNTCSVVKESYSFMLNGKNLMLFFARNKSELFHGFFGILR